MGYGALISGLVSAGMQIYSGLSTPSAQSVRGQYGRNLANIATKDLLPYANAQAWDLNIPSLASESINFGLQNAPAVNQSNMQQLQQMLNQALPGYQGMVNQAQTNTQSLLAGNIPKDVQDQIRMSSAFQTLQSGAFAGGAPTGALTARDLGLTSLNLQQQGFNQMNTLFSTARNFLMPQPVNPLSLLPLQDLISGNEWSKTQTYNARVQYANERANALAAQYGGPMTNNIGQLGQGIQTGLGALTAKNEQTGQNSFMSLLGSLFGQGGGNSFGFSGSSSGGGQSVGDWMSGASAGGSAGGSAFASTGGFNWGAGV